MLVTGGSGSAGVVVTDSAGAVVTAGSDGAVAAVAVVESLSTGDPSDDDEQPTSATMARHTALRTERFECVKDSNGASLCCVATWAAHGAALYRRYYRHCMDLNIAGRRAAVAAGSSGLGLGAASALAAEGAHVAICGRDADRLERAAASIGHEVVSIVADVGTAEGGAAFVEQARDALGGTIDILVPNAGGPPAGTFESTPVEAYPAALDLNLMSIVAMCKAAVPAMQQQGWGRVVAITSVSVRQPIPNIILSNTARAGATAFLKTLALEVANDGVTVNTVQPGIHDTPRLDALYTPEQKAQVRMGDADDFGSIVAFLCSEQSKFVNGLQLHVDGGSYAGLL